MPTRSNVIGISILEGHLGIAGMHTHSRMFVCAYLFTLHCGTKC